MDTVHGARCTGNQSEVARLRQQLDLEYEAAQRGLTGLAAVAQHDTILARMERNAGRLLARLQAGTMSPQQVMAAMNTENWDLPEEAEER